MGKPHLMSKQSAREARTSSSSSQCQPSPKRNCSRFTSSKMEAGEERQSFKQILDKRSLMEERIEEHFGSLKSEISRLSAKREEEGIKGWHPERVGNIPSVCMGYYQWFTRTCQALASSCKSLTHCDFKKTCQQSLDSHLQEINLLKTNQSAKSAFESQQSEIRALKASLANEQGKKIALKNYSQGEKTFD